MSANARTDGHSERVIHQFSAYAIVRRKWIEPVGKCHVMTDREEIESALEEFRSFSECLVKDVQFSDYQTTLTVDVDYTWDAQGKVREDVDIAPMIFRLTFAPVLEVRFQSGLNDYQLAHMDELNWGMNEIAEVRFAEDDGEISAYATHGIPVHKLTFLWSWGKHNNTKSRRIDVVFSSLSIQRVS